MGFLLFWKLSSRGLTAGSRKHEHNKYFYSYSLSFSHGFRMIFTAYTLDPAVKPRDDDCEIFSLYVLREGHQYL